MSVKVLSVFVKIESAFNSAVYVLRVIGPRMLYEQRSRANLILGKDKLSFICENALMVFSCQLQIIKALISSRYEKVV